jgi:mRNA interferase YafQ
MRRPFFTKQFQKDYKKMKNSGRNIFLLRKTLEKLINGLFLDPIYHDHALKGEWNNCRDCHIQSDWILIYKLIGKDKIYFERTGSHSELFN